MGIDNQKYFLKLKVIWKDDDMFELRVTVSNGRYFGTTEVYDNGCSLGDFAKSLFGYPKNEKILIHEAGQKEGYSYFGMKFYCIDDAGHIGVEVSLEDNVFTQHRQEEKSKLKLEIITEPSAIDIFQKELIQLVTKKDGIAILYGGG